MRAVCAPKCLEKDAHADFLCLHCYPNAVGDNTWAYFLIPEEGSGELLGHVPEEGSGKVPRQVPKRFRGIVSGTGFGEGFEAGSGQGSKVQVVVVVTDAR